jgi:FK506-binding protein 4/5
MAIIEEENDEEEANSEPEQVLNVEFDCSQKKDGGIVKKIIKLGTGPSRPESGDEVTVHYTGRLLDGTKFDSSVDRGDPFVFKIGLGQVIKGWDEGVAGMYLGEKCVLTCRSEYAYGKRGSPPTIPADATLEFEVELLGWKSENDLSGDGGVVRVAKVIEGEGWENPKKGDSCEVSFEVSKKDSDGKMCKVKEEQTVFMVMGSDEEHGGVPCGVHMALKFFNKGETQRLLIKNLSSRGKKNYLENFADIEDNNDELYFTVTLKRWIRMEMICGGLGSKTCIVEPAVASYETPNEGATVVFSSVKVYAGKHDDFAKKGATNDTFLVAKREHLVYESSEEEGYTFEIGHDEEDAVIVAACEEGIQKMKAGETAQIIIPSEFAFGEAGRKFDQTGKSVQPNSFVTYVLALKSMERAKESWAMTGEEKAEKAEKLKLSGNTFFKNKDFTKAEAKYSQGLKYVEADGQQSEETAAKIKALKLSLCLNCAACALKRQMWKKVISLCDDALKIEALNDKALYRKATAEIEFELYDDAKSTLKRIFEEVDENHEEARKLRQRLKQKEALQRKKDSKVFGGMFSKLELFTEDERNKKPKSDEDMMRDTEISMEGLGNMMGGQGMPELAEDGSQRAPLPMSLDDLKEEDDFYGAKAAMTETFPFEEEKLKLEKGEKMSLESA